MKINIIFFSFFSKINWISNRKYCIFYIENIIKLYYLKIYMPKNFLKTIYFDTSKIWENKFINEIEVFKNITSLDLEQPITYFIWENGSGKSTLLENIATSFWFNKEWGTKNSFYQTNAEDNLENNWIQLSWQPTKFQYWYFFRAEWIYNFINYLENISWFHPYGWENLHNMSHGQQFLRIFESQMNSVWFYILDEIESALSPENQLKVVEIIKYMVSKWSQFLIATHSPIILNIKNNSQILSFDYWYIHEIEYEFAPCVDIYKRLFKN